MKLMDSSPYITDRELNSGNSESWSKECVRVREVGMEHTAQRVYGVHLRGWRGRGSAKAERLRKKVQGESFT